MTSESDGFTRIGETINTVLKEVLRRTELRSRLEAEMARPVSDDEFLAIVERTGMRI
jgi:hypothetical protein